MEDETLVLLLFLIIIVIGIIIINPLKQLSKEGYPTNDEANNLTLYLNQLGVTLYYSPECSYCIAQDKYINKTMLLNKINILEHSNNNINGIPAWELNGEISTGLLTYNQLSKKYGYNQ